jgi:hypothetical protein
MTQRKKFILVGGLCFIAGFLALPLSLYFYLWISAEQKIESDFSVATQVYPSGPAIAPGAFPQATSPWRLELDGEEITRILSAGPDGIRGTADDWSPWWRPIEVPGP